MKKLLFPLFLVTLAAIGTGCDLELDAPTCTVEKVTEFRTGWGGDTQNYSYYSTCSDGSKDASTIQHFAPFVGYKYEKGSMYRAR